MVRYRGLIVLAVLLIPVSSLGATSKVGMKTIVNFGVNTNATFPLGPLVRATDGNYYGTTGGGGADDLGTVYKMTPGGDLTVIYSFCGTMPDCDNGAFGPQGNLIQATDGNFYGTTSIDGSGPGDEQGTVFKITPDGVLTPLYVFCSQPNCTDGVDPITVLQAADGNLYGTTAFGGANGFYSGTIFKLTLDGRFTTIYNFCSQPNCADGGGPQSLIQATDGNFYGTTKGSIFKITPDGTLTTLYAFCSQPNCADGSEPAGGLIQATDGNLYGVTVTGGTGTNGICQNNDTCGTIYRITPDGTFTTLHNFDSVDGRFPHAGLVQATDGNLYGTTSDGGAGGKGTVFRIGLNGAFTTLRRFKGANGAYPVDAMIQSPGGNLLGTTVEGGSDNKGTIFTINAKLGPFVEESPVFGPVGATVTILMGTQKQPPTGVTFNGTPAAFQIISNAAIQATVPDGATSGPIVVTTPSHSLTSNVDFQVN